MNIKVQSPNQKIKTDFENKIIDELELIERKYPRLDSAVVTLHEIKTDNKKNRIVDLKIILPKGILFISHRGETFELAFSKCLHTLTLKLKKSLDKLRNIKHAKILVEQNGSI